MLKFWKYQATGNDFVIVDRSQEINLLSSEVVQRICKRNTGVGADGVLSYCSSETADARMHIQNSDGSDAGMCGNGIRALVRYLYDESHIAEDRPSLTLEVNGQEYGVSRLSHEIYEVDMGIPVEIHAELPLADAGGAYQIDLDDKVFKGWLHHFGNPHFSVLTSDDPMVLAQTYGGVLERHETFPNRANIGFARYLGDGVLEMVVYERGVGITQACGSGACAMGVSALKQGLRVQEKLYQIQLPGGRLMIRVDSSLRVFMRGEAQRVFMGTVEDL
ncbi:MAG: diaminopimelate epimerase [Myxococcota bacterium]|nr:diaminopimelate epimerase [Myxococcota bacterium]